MLGGEGARPPPVRFTNAAEISHLGFTDGGGSLHLVSAGI